METSLAQIAEPDYRGLCSTCRHRDTRWIRVDAKYVNKYVNVCLMFIEDQGYTRCIVANPNHDCNKWQAKPWTVFKSETIALVEIVFLCVTFPVRFAWKSLFGKPPRP